MRRPLALCSLVAALGHGHKAQMQGLKLIQGQVQRRQGHFGTDLIAGAAFARHGQTGGAQRVQIAVNRPLGHPQRCRQILGPMGARGPQQQQQFGKAVFPGHLGALIHN